MATLLDHRGNPIKSERRLRQIRGKYDAAQTTPENRRHWANADALSALSANSPAVRQKLRMRSRYEVANNSYARGIVNTRANHVVGTGPRLNVETGDASVDRAIERAFNAWSEEIELAEKLRTMQKAKIVDGESFALLVTNPKVATAVKLDLSLYEGDQISTPGLYEEKASACDGIVFDRWGNPETYHLLKTHPGDYSAYMVMDDYNRIDAADVLHWFRCDRPGQRRGIPEILPSLPLFAMLRRYTLAVIGAAETVADWAGVLWTDSPPDQTAEDAEPFEEIELASRLLTVVPAGWKLGQIQAEQPTTTYQMFKSEILNEIARCLDMPYNIAAANSSNYNYASGRLDHQSHFKSVEVERFTKLLRRIVRAFVDEASLVGAIPAALPPFDSWTVSFFWDGFLHADPVKEANAQEKRLANNTTTLAIECAREGRDWQDVLKQRAKELKLWRDLTEELGIDPDADMQGLADEDEDEDGDGAPAFSRNGRAGA